MPYCLDFKKEDYVVKTAELEGQKVTYYAWENIVYVENPVDTARQCLNIYVPKDLYEQGYEGGHTLKDCPIIMPNDVGGYAPAFPLQPGRTFKGTMNATFYALLKGYVVVTPGARGRGLKDEAGKFYGCAPAGLVDLKAAIRYLRYNKNVIFGDTEKIITNGTSAGGAMSSLLGATGNHPDYEPYLETIGAAKERDDVFAASCYCPITNLDHADMAYEWEFNKEDVFHFFKFEMVDGKPAMTPMEGTLSENQKRLSGELKPMFPAYLNSLELTDEDGTPLTLDADGNGSFKEFVKKYVLRSAQKEMDRGTDLSGLSWLTVCGGRAADMDFDGYVAFRNRMKPVPAFDNVSMGTPENELFGTPDMMYRHFTRFSTENSQVNGRMAEEQQIKMMNPMYYIEDDRCDTAKYFRIRHGAVDRDTSLAISAMLTAKLRNHGVDVDYHLPWGIPHAGDYDLEELFDWIGKITA